MITKWIKRLFVALIIITIIFIIILHIGASSFRFPESSFPDGVEMVKQNYNNKEVRYAKTENTASDNLILFVHGAPGSAGDLIKYLQIDTLQKQASLISIDRLGYGYSDYGNVATIKEQVDYLNFIISKEGIGKSIYLVGHSYGGPIIAAYANAHKADGILLLAAVIDPYNEKIFWFSYFSFWKATRWLLPGYIKVAGAEKESHASELLKMKDVWSKLDVPVIMIHDSLDYIAPGIENITWATAQIKDSLFYFQPSIGDSHFIPFENEELTTSMILRLLNNKKK